MLRIEGLETRDTMRKLIVRMIVGAVLLLSVITVFSGAVLWNSYDQARRAVTRQMQVDASYNEQNLTRTVDSIDSALERIRASLDPTSTRPYMQDLLADVLRFSPHLRQIMLVNDQGLVIADTAKAFHADQADMGRIDLVALGLADDGMRSLGSRLRVGKAAPRRFIGPAGSVGAPASYWTLPVALMRDGPGLALHIVAAVNPTELVPNLGSAVYADDGQALVAYLDGAVVLSSDALKAGVGGLPRSTLSLHVTEHFLQSDAGTFSGPTPFREGDGIIAYHLSPIYPLAIVIAASDRGIVGEWLAGNRVFVAIAIAIPFAAAALLALFGVQAAQKLRLDEGVRALSRVVEQSPVSIMITDREGQFRYVNQAFTDLFGYTFDDVKGQTPRILKSGEMSLDTYQKIWSTILASGVWRGAIVNQTKDADKRWVSATIFGLSVAGEPPELLVGIETDITVQKKFEHQLIEEKLRAESANAAKAKFLSSMSHELRTPLNAILGFGQLLQLDAKEPLSDKQHTSVATILQNGRHLLELVSQVLELAEIDVGKQKLVFEDVMLAEACMRCVNDVKPQAEERGIDIAVAVDEGVSAWADPMRLHQVLLNLLSNAVKYNRDGGEVRVRAEAQEHDQVRLSVSDTGEGIAEELFDQMFEPFNRLGKENSATPGTGIGLNITRDLVEAMDGGLGFESTVGRGSTFWVDLPRNPPLDA